MPNWPPFRRLRRAVPPRATPSGRSEQHAENHASRHAENAADEVLVENLGTGISSNEIVAGDGSGGLKTQTANCRVFTGTYVGDGETSQAITMVGAGPSFTVLYVRIWTRVAVDNDPVIIIETTDIIIDDHANKASIRIESGGVTMVVDAIIALGGADFTVDDAGADDHPNKNNTTYNYAVWGV